jgi:hypothetical protein
MTVQALARRFGFRRPPVVTAVVFVLTAATSVLGLLVPGVLAALQRTPQGLHGDWWRTFTSLFVQDGGVAGTISNLAFLLVMGVLAEQVLGAWQWLVCYFGAGLVGELAGYAWQPRGAGNSVAICGLAGGLTVALAVEAGVPRLAPVVLAYWAAALLGAVGAGPAAGRRGRRRGGPGRAGAGPARRAPGGRGRRDRWPGPAGREGPPRRGDGGRHRDRRRDRPAGGPTGTLPGSRWTLVPAVARRQARP